MTPEVIAALRYYFEADQQVDASDPRGLILPPCSCPACATVRRLGIARDLEARAEEVRRTFTEPA